MDRVSSLFLPALYLFQVLTLNGQTTPPPSDQVTGETLPRRFVVDEWRMWTSPVRPASYSSHAVKKYVIPFTLIAGALIATDRRTADLLPNSPDQTRWGGRGSQLGAWYSLAGIAGSTYVVGKFAGNDHAKETGLLGLEALGHAQVAVFAIKELTNRERPINGRGGFWEGGNAFPSGHVTSAFAVATVFAYEYRDHIAVPITAYSLASVIAASRSAARQHWASDIFVGGALGFMVGRFTYKRNHNPALPGSKVLRTGALVPQIGVGPSGPILSWAF